MAKGPKKKKKKKSGGEERPLERLLTLTLPLSVALAAKEVSVGEVLQLRPGDVLEFDSPVDDPVSVQIGSKVIADGLVVKSGEKFGLRIHTILSPQETVKLLGA